MDYLKYAKDLKIVPVWQKNSANTSGHLTPPELYTPYKLFTPRVLIIHATGGTNTLPYFAGKVDANWVLTREAGSIRDGRRVCAHQLIPKDDFTIYDLVPAGYGCGHANPAKWRGHFQLNLQAWGLEIENKQDGDNGDQFTEAQYIKTALTVAYKTASVKMRNLFVTSHHLAAPGHRSDPDAGPWNWGQFWGHLWEIRKDKRIFDWWNVEFWDGR